MNTTMNDARELAAAFRKLFSEGMKINEILARNEDLNNSVPTNWPLAMSADEWAHECADMADHYDAMARETK